MTNLSKKLRKYFEIAKVSYFNQTAYIWDAVGIGLLVMFRVFILIQLYKIAFQVGGSATISGLDLKETMWVLGLTQSFYISNRLRLITKNMGDEIQSGTVAYNLTKPYSYILYNLSSHFGIIGANLFFALFFTSLVLWLGLGIFHVSIIALFAGILLVVIGYIINNLIGIIMGLSAFWIEDISAFRWIYDKILFILGGIFVPLTIFPDSIRAFIDYLPFSQIFFNPALIIVKYSPELFFKFLAIQIVWIILLSALAKLIFAKGSKMLAINGG